MIQEVNGRTPKLGKNAFVAEGAFVLGDVTLGEDASVWYGAVIRGDINWIRIGDRSNIQDGVVIHVNHKGQGVRVGNEVLVGHRVVLHACTVEDGALIGNGAVVLDGAHIGARAMVAAGSVVPPGAKVPPETLVMGSPARPKRALTPEEMESNRKGSLRYVRIKEAHRTPGVLVEYGPEE
ncbi:acetyltransferase [Dethiosulfatarculus sandiegensis]|uniref:Acetyltransferase n=1 Tax=Dethiosulfatarculus sandiegensis TaxID=1429043 RepID=A0A0D2HST9_9BACT|nr:gamma carbonic anhydrase family protein [Dethiosulfatarculus sandiegensis]KIX13593.1 acetyltransferase [Dethiosulfatarculus sandiegensis]